MEKMPKTFCHQELQFTPTMSCHWILVRMSKMGKKNPQQLTVLSAGEQAQQQKCSFIVRGKA